MNKLIALLLFVVAVPQFSFGQDRKIDQLEVLYSQKHYTKVIRKANKLLAIPDYDYSGMPTFYKSLATFKLLKDEDWTKRNSNGLSSAISLYDEFLAHQKKVTYIKAHYFEIVELKQYLTALEKELKSQKKIAEANKVTAFLNTNLKNISSFGFKNEPVVEANSTVDKEPKNSANNKPVAGNDMREEMVSFASGFIGTPYQWAGNTPKGFDCSGYVTYVYQKYGINMPRTAASQKLKAKAIKDDEATKGDLVFFKSGSKITHVGIVISEPGEPLEMVHSSTSKGIIKTKVKTSSYWSKKYAGAGRVIE